MTSQWVLKFTMRMVDARIEKAEDRQHIRLPTDHNDHMMDYEAFKFEEFTSADCQFLLKLNV
jgi:hypothetical protein